MIISTSPLALAHRGRRRLDPSSGTLSLQGIILGVFACFNIIFRLLPGGNTAQLPSVVSHPSDLDAALNSHHGDRGWTCCNQNRSVTNGTYPDPLPAPGMLVFDGQAKPAISTLGGKACQRNSESFKSVEWPNLFKSTGITVYSHPSRAVTPFCRQLLPHQPPDAGLQPSYFRNTGRLPQSSLFTKHLSIAVLGHC